MLVILKMNPTSSTENSQLCVVRPCNYRVVFSEESEALILSFIYFKAIINPGQIALSLLVENTKIYSFVKAMPISVTQLTFHDWLELQTCRVSVSKLYFDTGCSRPSIESKNLTIEFYHHCMLLFTL